MITLPELMHSCRDVMSTLYPDIRIYGPDTTEGFDKPCFCTELILYKTASETKNFRHTSAAFKITFLQETTDIADQLEKFEAIREAFGIKLKVGNRFLTCNGDIEMDYTGEKNDWMQITIPFEWYEQITETPEAETISSINISYGLKEREG